MLAHQSIICYMLLALADVQPLTMQRSLDPWRPFANCEMRGHTFVETFWQEAIDEQIHDLLQGNEE